MVIAALGVESLPLLRRLDGAQPLSPRLVVGRLAQVEVAVLTAGVGPEKAERRTRRALEQWAPDRAISFGTCGALVDGLAIGDVVVGSELMAEQTVLGTLAPLNGRAVRITTVGTPVYDASRRTALAELGAEICEMEAAAVWRAAQGAPTGPPLVSALKIVSDRAGGEADAVLGPGGFQDAARIARFKARALSLCERILTPSLFTLLETA